MGGHVHEQGQLVQQHSCSLDDEGEERGAEQQQQQQQQEEEEEEEEEGCALGVSQMGGAPTSPAVQAIRQRTLKERLLRRRWQRRHVDDAREAEDLTRELDTVLADQAQITGTPGRAHV
jgi:hypothetical protein